MSMLQRAIYSMVQIKFEHCIYMALVLVGADTLGSLLGGSLDGLLAGKDGSDAGKSSLFMIIITIVDIRSARLHLLIFANRSRVKRSKKNEMKKKIFKKERVCSQVTVARL